MKEKIINKRYLIALWLILFLSIINFNGIFHQINYLDERGWNLRENIKTTDYSSFFERRVDDINISLHQSLLNTTLIQFSNINNANTFSQKCPADRSFNSSFVNMTIENVNASVKRLEFENSSISTERLTDYDHAIGFQVRGNCTLDNVSIMLSETNDAGSDDADCVLRIYTAQWSGSQIEPSTTALTPIQYFTVYNAESKVYHNFTGLNAFLDVTETYNNYFFVILVEILPVNAFVDIEVNLDTSKDCLLYRDTDIWELRNNLEPVMYVDLIPPPSTPSNLNLTINEIAVEDSLDNNGYWKPDLELGSDSGNLDFVIKANWWDVSCDITSIQINYTKTDLTAKTSLRCSGTNQDILWNVSCPIIDYFSAHSDLQSEKINITIPTSWRNVQIWNGSTNKTSDILVRSSSDKFEIITITNAGNGKYWYLTGESENLVNSVEIFVDSTLINHVNYTDIVHFNATFKKILAQDNGIINLSIYNPAMLSNRLNFTLANSTFASGSKFYLGKWDVSDTVNDYGDFRVQVSWNNNTAAGFIEKSLIILAQTDLTLIAPNQDSTFYNNQLFNIIVYYQDSNQLKAIDGASIQYNIHEQGWQSTSSNNGTVGYYVIPVNCNTFNTNGIKTVEIIISKNYHENQILSYNFNVQQNGGPGDEFPLAIIIITVILIVGGIGVSLFLLRKKK